MDSSEEVLAELRKIRELLNKPPAPPKPEGLAQEFKAFLSEYKVLGLAVAFILGLAVRVITMLGFPPAIWFGGDSASYLSTALYHAPGTSRLSGYGIMLFVLHPFHSFAVVTAVQHLLGLAVATKFYPIVFFGPLLLLCLRAGRLRAFAVTGISAAVTWLAVNLPIVLIAPRGWSRFYRMSDTRPADWGSIWYFFQTEHWPLVGSLRQSSLNAFSLAVFAACCVVLAVIILAAPRRPRLPQVFFLVLALFLLANKVWSPQYVIWLVPLAVLARPRLWPYALWQLAEIGYFFAIWAYLVTLLAPSPLPPTAGGIGNGLYFAALLARFATVSLLCVLVIRDILRPDGDVVRADGEDDPAGGVLADAPDRFVLRLRSRPAVQDLADTG